MKLLGEQAEDADANVRNGLTFYKHYLRGVFCNHTDSAIVVAGDMYKVWPYIP
jgi:hypothetical protein